MGQGTGARLDQQRVGVAVIVAFKLDDLVTSREPPRQPDCRHSGFGTGIDHAYQLYRGNDFTDQLRHAGFNGGRSTKRETVIELTTHRAQYIGIGMPGNHRPPRTDIVDITLTLHIEQVGTLGSLHKHRRPMKALESTHWRVDATRNIATSLFEQC